MPAPGFNFALPYLADITHMVHCKTIFTQSSLASSLIYMGTSSYTVARRSDAEIKKIYHAVASTRRKAGPKRQSM